jgi:serine/threonine-protein kinase
MRATRRRYEPGIELGRGSTATVWRARDTKTRREVALKRFHPHLVADPVARQRIEAEAGAASRVSHPNIVAAIDTIEDGDGLALVFPYVAGETLAKRLERKPKVDPRQAARVALDIADALAAAHAQGVVHRDVKPGNILLGTDGRARLLDFGIAHAIEADQAAHELTGAGMAIGTLPYMAPEQLAADPTTPASDVYALGVVLYEMLAGRRPYQATSPVTLANEQAQSPARIAGVPDALSDVAIAAMSTSAEARPVAAQLGRVLRGWLDGRGAPDAATSTYALAAQATAAHATAGPRARPVQRWVALGLVVIFLAAAVPIIAAGFIGGPSATPSAGSPAAALIIPSPSVPPVETPAATPVIRASDIRPPSKPADTGGKDSHPGHHKRRHHDRGHGRTTQD